MKQPKCHNVLFDGLNSDKDPLGQNVHWTDTAHDGLGSSMYQGEDWLAWRIAGWLLIASLIAVLIIVGGGFFFAWAGGYA